MTTESSNDKIYVILGAGASHDVRNEDARIMNLRFKPPLAKDLFNLEEHEDYRNVIEPYKGAVVIAQELAPKN